MSQTLDYLICPGFELPQIVLLITSLNFFLIGTIIRRIVFLLILNHLCSILRRVHLPVLARLRERPTGAHKGQGRRRELHREN